MDCMIPVLYRSVFVFVLPKTPSMIPIELEGRLKARDTYNNAIQTQSQNAYQSLAELITKSTPLSHLHSSPRY
jgi:hypothetical protein